MLRISNISRIVFLVVAILITSALLLSPQTYAAFPEGSPLWVSGGVEIGFFLSPGDRASPKAVCVNTLEGIVVWQDKTHGDPSGDIYADKIDLLTGASLWGGPKKVCGAAGLQEKPQIASDGAGGALITWQDFRSGVRTDIYVQALDGATGNPYPGWPADGFAMCTAGGANADPQIICASTGEAIVTWQDLRDGVGNIYAQKISAAGVVSWMADGKVICNATGIQIYPQICSDGAGGAFITWDDYRGGLYPDIYANKITSGGIVWGNEGLPVCVLQGAQLYPQIVSDGSGGAIIAWDDEFIGNGDIYAQRIRSDGSNVWSFNGIPICSEPTQHQIFAQIAADGWGGAIITWQDFRNGNNDIYAQKVDGNGVIEESWPTNGVPVCVEPHDQTGPRIAGDGWGGAIITWEDTRDAVAEAIHVYAQKVNSDGSASWTGNGVRMCSSASGDQKFPAIAHDNMGGALVVWQDYRPTAPTGIVIYGNRIWGPHSPQILRDTIRLNGQLISQVNYLPKRPQVEATIKDEYLNLRTTSVEVQFGTQVFVATTDADLPNNQVRIYFVPDTDIASGVSTMYIRARNFFDKLDLFKKGTFNVPGEVSVVGNPRNIPNPFRPRHGTGTIIEYKLNGDAAIKLLIYDITGRSIWQRNYMPGENGGTVVNGVFWDGKNEFGEYVGNGAYVYIITTDAKVIGKGFLAVAD